MLSIGKVTPEMGPQYYSHEDYYSRERGPLKNEIYGESANLLNIKKFDVEMFQKILETGAFEGTLLRSKRNNKGKRRAAFDLTFSAPKSVTMLGVVKGDRRVLKAHQEAVREALGYAENLVQTRVRDGLHRNQVKTNNFMAFMFHHGSSRGEDPQLHTHCVIPNGTYLKEKGRWQSISNETFYQQSKLIGTIYQKVLGEELQSLGYEVVAKSNNTIEIKGYSDRQLESFSQRSADLDRHVLRREYASFVKDQLLDEGIESVVIRNKVYVDQEYSHNQFTTEKTKLGFLVRFHDVSFDSFVESTNYEVTKKDRDSVVLVNRKKKTAKTPQELMASWQAKCQELGVIHPESQAVKRGRETNIELPVDIVMNKDSVATRKDLYQAALSSNLLSKDSWQAIFKKIDQNVLSMNDTEITIKERIEEEKKILSYLDHDSYRLAGSYSSIPKENGYTKGQQDAFNLAVTSNQFISMWQGVAGSGKTYALNDVFKCYKEENKSLLSMAPDASSAKSLGDATNSHAVTIDSFLLNSKKADLLVIDEAGKVSTKKMSRLLEVAHENKSKVLLVGDANQMGAVEAGSPFKLLLEAQSKKATLGEFRRQKEATLKKAVEKSFLGQVDEAFLESNTVICHSEFGRIRKAVDEYLKKPKTLMIADLNKDRERLNFEVRRRKKIDQSLSSHEISLTTLKAKSLSQPEMMMSQRYDVGDIVKLKSRKECLEVQRVGDGEIYTENKSVSLKDIESVFVKKEIKIAEGDELKWSKNHENRVNGRLVKVTEIKDGKVILEGENKTYIINQKDNQFLDYSYAETSYSSQGKTCDQVVIYAGKNASRESFYVGISRAKYKATIFSDNDRHFKKRIKRSSAKENALGRV